MLPLIIIGGTTASYKTKVSIELALQLNAEIINADSKQIYQYMNIGTAKPTPTELSIIQHHMIDVVTPDKPFDAGEFVRLASDMITDIQSRQKRVIVTGGTGLYIKALLWGLATESSVDHEFRTHFLKLTEEKGLDYWYKELQSVDPISAFKIHPNDALRIGRALEIFHTTGKTKSSWCETHQKDLVARYPHIYFTISPDTDVLYQRINERCQDMAKNGLFEEVRKLLNMGYGFDCHGMKTIGYQEFKDCLAGRYSVSETIEMIAKATRHYAKRQRIWNRSISNVISIESNHWEDILRQILTYLTFYASYEG